MVLRDPHFQYKPLGDSDGGATPTILQVRGHGHCQLQNLWAQCKMKMQVSNLKYILGLDLVVQWLRFCAPNARGPCQVPDQGTRSCMLQD